MTRVTKYKEKITIQTATKVKDGKGGWTNSWADWYDSWASVNPISGGKYIHYSRMGFTESYEVEMRKRESNVTGSCRVVYDGNNYQINSLVIHDETVKLDIAR